MIISEAVNTSENISNPIHEKIKISKLKVEEHPKWDKTCPERN